MKLLWFILVLHTTLALAGFGRAYMRKSKLCHQWICINNKLHLPDDLPPKEDFTRVLHDLLPPNSWQGVVEQVVEKCYNNRSRRYSNTCPGQAVLHCAVDQLSNNCPLEFTKPHDGCAPVNSLAGFGNMFTQSRYQNMDTYLPLETRPMWFLKNYFNSACCDIPQLFNSTVLTECGFTSMLAYYTHKPVLDYGQFHPTPAIPLPKPEISEQLHVDGVPEHHNVSNGLIIEDFDTEQTNTNLDPLDCCRSAAISNFIPPVFRHQCDFKLKWEGQKRLVIEETVSTDRPTTTSERPVVHRDIMLLPQSCEKETCLFKKLGVLSDSNTVNVALFAKLLDNFTSVNPSWESAKARAITTCLERPLDYGGDCQINRVLTCVFDVLTENCPQALKNDPCKHNYDGRICLISSSKYRPKHRRGTCNLPSLVNSTILKECGLTSISRIEQVNSYNTPKKHIKLTKIGCKDLTPSTSCVLTKMGVLNKYGFMDYFKMKDRLKNLPHLVDTYNLEATYEAAFKNAPLYKAYCNSPKKLLNILDTMLLTCPPLDRNPTTQCSKLFEDIRSTSPNPQEHMEHFHHVYYPSNYHTRNPIHKKYSSKIVKKPIYNYGLLNSKYAPKVETIDLIPKVEKKPLVLLPVYIRVPNTNLVLRPHDSSLRSGFFLPNSGQTQGQSISPISTTVSTISTASTASVSTTSPISPTPVTYLRIPNTNLLVRPNNNRLLFHQFWKNSGVAHNKYSTISPSYESVSAISTNEPVSTTSTDVPVFTTSTNEEVSTTSTNE